MSFRKAHLFAFSGALYGAIIGAFIGCSSAPKTARSPSPAPRAASAVEIERIHDAIGAASRSAQSLFVEGDITFEHDGESNNASFIMRSKRRDLQRRIDSLSIEVKGPFGIKLARFLASPEGYQMYDILHGETMHGRTDAHTLESITQMKGLSLSMMSDLAYGLAPGSETSLDDSTELSVAGNRERLTIWHPATGVRETLDFATDNNALRLLQYARAIGGAQVTIRFSKHEAIQGFAIPSHIEVSSESGKLILDYTKIDLNPEPMTVKIKMPSQ